MNLDYFLNSMNDVFRFVVIILVYLLVIAFFCYLILFVIWWSLMLTRFLMLFFSRNFGKNRDLEKFVFPVPDGEGEDDA